MSGGLFWLNDKQWARIEPHLPTGLTGPGRDDDRRILSGSFTCCNPAPDGATVRANTALTPRSTIASIAGPSAADGAQSLKPWLNLAKMPWCSRSTRHRSKLTGVPPVEKGGAQSGHRPVAGRSYDKNPCAERSALPAGRPASDPRSGCRHRCCPRCSGARTTYERASRRQRVRR